MTHVGGIENMRARVEQSLGGTFSLETNPGQGVQITYRIPLSEAKEKTHDNTTETATGTAG